MANALTWQDYDTNSPHENIPRAGQPGGSGVSTGAQSNFAPDKAHEGDIGHSYGIDSGADALYNQASNASGDLEYQKQVADKQAYYQGDQATQNKINAMQDAVNTRGTNQFSVGQDQINRYGGSNAGPYAHANAAQLGQGSLSNYTNIGNANMMGATSAQGANVNQQFRQGQVGLMGQLQAQANGTGPSLAAGQMRQAQDRNLAQQAGLAAAQGGRNAASTQRGLAMQAAQTNQQTNSDVAQLRLQEQISAQQQLAGVTNAGRGSDFNEANLAQNNQQFNAANQQQANQFNAGALNQRQLSQAQMNQDVNFANQNANLTQNSWQQQANLANQKAQQDMAQYNASNQQQAILAGNAAGNQALFNNQNSNLQQQGQNDAANSELLKQQAQSDQYQQSQQEAYQNYLASERSAGHSEQYIPTGLNPDGTYTPPNGQITSDENAKTDIKPTPTASDAKDSGMSTAAATNGAVAIGQYAAKESGSNKAAGVATGAGSGAALGTAVYPGIGTAVGAIAGGIAGYFTSSDKNAKKDIKKDSDASVEKKIQAMLDDLKSYDYKYKNPELPGRAKGKPADTTFTSVMAQDLEKSKLGDQAVIDTPNGKMVDYARLGAIMLAGQAMMNDRLNKLEGNSKQKRGK